MHEADTNFFSYALPEKMSVYAILESYEQVKELGDEYGDFRHKLPAAFYLSYGTALDQMEMYDEAQNMYRQLLKEFPLNYSLWYNYGGSLKLDEKYDLAWEVFQKTIKINPVYDRVHLQVADMAFSQKQTAKGLLAIHMYLTLTPANRNTLNTSWKCQTPSQTQNTGEMKTVKPLKVQILAVIVQPPQFTNCCTTTQR